MKKVMVVLLTVFVFGLLCSNEFMQPKQAVEDFQFKGVVNSIQDSPTREQDPPPVYSFILNGAGQSTTYMYDSYYDYMPYSYNGHNVRLQPEMSMPYGYAAGGMYISYHCSETTSVGTDRRAWNSYLNPDGTLLNSGATNQYSVIREGFTTVAIDPETGDPFFAWHSVVEPDNTYDCSMTYDNFHLTGAPGYWRQPFILFDNPEASQPFTGAPDDEFIWPVIMIGNSPNEGMRRVHAYGNNYTSNSAGGANYNSLYAYADFGADSLLFESDLTWTYQSFPFMDDLHYNDIARVNKDFIVYEDKVAFFGGYEDDLFVLLSTDCGENFTLYTQEWLYPVDNPLQQDGVTYEFYNNDLVTPAELYFTLSNDGTHYNGVFTDNGNKVMWMTSININNLENIDTGYYMPAFCYPKIFTFDITTQTFSFYDMDIQGVDPADDQPCIPWDLDEDGQVDEYYDDGSVYIPLSMPSWFFNSDQGYQDSFFHESNYRMIANNNWIVVGWHDCKKHRYAYFGVDGYDGWLYQPEIAISISDDYGATWSEPRYLNANPNDAVVDPDNNYDGNYTPELADMLPVNITFGDKLEILGNEPGNYHAKLHFAFFDDNDYGSGAGQTTGGGQVNGGKLRYAALDLEFQSPWIEPSSGADDNTIAPAIASLWQNYPNPFNPETSIRFQLKADADVELSVYNLKGQKVCTLLDEHRMAGDYQLTWNGRDDNGEAVASGVYFYKLRTDDSSTTRKMVLMK